MHKRSRGLRAAVVGVTAAAALAVALTGQANAASTTLRLHTNGDLSKFLSDSPVGLAEMHKSNTADPAQKWVRTDTTLGYATYKNVKSGRCLTGRGLQGIPLVTVQTCEAGSLAQQWRLGVSGQLELRLNHLAAEHNLASTSGQVRMAFFTAKANQKWHTHPA